MSRILWVKDDDREVPRNACWWRIRLTPGENGYLYVIQADRNFPDAWSAYLEYYDGLNDWSWPFKVRTHGETVVPSDIYSITTRGATFIDILDVVPPSPPSTRRSRWYRLTKGQEYSSEGNLYEPDYLTFQQTYG